MDIIRNLSSRSDLEQLLEGSVDGEPSVVAEVIAEIVSETGRYEDVDADAVIEDAQTRVIRAMGVEDWR